MVDIENDLLHIAYDEGERSFTVIDRKAGSVWRSLMLERRFRVLEADADSALAHDRIQLRLYDRNNQADLLATWAVQPDRARLTMALNAFEGNGAALLEPIPYPPLFVPAESVRYTTHITEEVQELPDSLGNWQRVALRLATCAGDEAGPTCLLTCTTARHLRIEHTAGQEGEWKLIWDLDDGLPGGTLGYTRIATFDFLPNYDVESQTTQV